MITELTVERFKCWHTTQSFELAPLTVFFGETGTGKSTVGHLLTLLKQTVTTSDSSVVLYPGDPDSILPLGTYGSLLHKHERSGGLRFSYRWQLPEYLEVVDTTEYTAEGRPSQYQVANEMMFQCHVNFNTANYPFVQTISYQLYDNNKRALYCIE